MKNSLSSAILVVILSGILTEQSIAIPAFARKYDMSCTTCHSGFPRLKAFGDEFAGNGFRLEGKEPPRYYRETGDDLLMLLREIPLAMRVEGYLRYQPQTAHRSDFQSPYLFKLLSGAQIAQDVSYYFYFFFGERGEVAGLEDAFVMFNNIFHTDLDVYVGQFQLSDPLFKRELRLTLEDYQIYRTKVGSANANLTYDRGVMFTYSLPTKTDLALEILNGSGIGGADGARNFDDDKYKNLLLRASQDVGEHIRVGAFGFLGNQENNAIVNKTQMVGPDFSVSYGNLELNYQYVARFDDHPSFLAGEQEKKTEGIMAELVYSPNGDQSRWYGVMLYNLVRSDQSALNYETLTGHYSYLLARNIRLVGEYTYDLKLKANKFTAGFVAAF